MRPIFALFACVFASSAAADVVTNGYIERQTHLVWVHGGKAVLARCLDGTTIFSHDTCRQVVLVASAPLFFAELTAHYEGDLPRAETLIRETWVNLERVDTRLFELVAAVMPDPGAEVVTVEQLERAARALASAEGSAAATRDQIARVAEELASGTGDPELVAQLEVLKKSLNLQSEAAETRRSDLSSLRRRYVAQRSLEDDADFNDLKAMRERLVSRLSEARTSLRFALAQAARGATMSRRVAETFAWDETLGHFSPHPVVSAVESAERAARTFRVSSPDPRALLMLEVTRQGRYESFRCNFGLRPSPATAPMSCKLLIATGGDYVRVGLTRVGDGTLEFQPQFQPNSSEYETLMRMGLITPVVGEGLWAFHLECALDDGGVPDAFGPGSCALTFKRE